MSTRKKMKFRKRKIGTEQIKRFYQLNSLNFLLYLRQRDKLTEVRLNKTHSYNIQIKSKQK